MVNKLFRSTRTRIGTFTSFQQQWLSIPSSTKFGKNRDSNVIFRQQLASLLCLPTHFGILAALARFVNSLWGLRIEARHQENDTRFPRGPVRSRSGRAFASFVNAAFILLLEYDESISNWLTRESTKNQVFSSRQRHSRLSSENVYPPDNRAVFGALFALVRGHLNLPNKSGPIRSFGRDCVNERSGECKSRERVFIFVALIKIEHSGAGKNRGRDWQCLFFAPVAGNFPRGRGKNMSLTMSMQLKVLCANVLILVNAGYFLFRGNEVCLFRSARVESRRFPLRRQLA